jgi:hypothetical protein
LKAPGFDSVIDRKNGVAVVDLSVVYDRHHGVQAAFGNVEDLAKIELNVVAGDAVWR